MCEYRPRHPLLRGVGARPEHQDPLRDRFGGNCQLIEISSMYGHDAFFKESAVLRDVFYRTLE
mgnify:CR=1 FL=1